MRRRIAARILLAIVVLNAGMPAHAAPYRKWYGNGNKLNHWAKYNNGSYEMNYRYLRGGQYHCHHVYYSPGMGNYYYFFSPRTKKYWGRCPVNVSPQNPYEILSAPDQREELAQINVNNFIKLSKANGNLKVEVVTNVTVMGEIETDSVAISTIVSVTTGMPKNPMTGEEIADPDRSRPPPPPDALHDDFMLPPPPLPFPNGSNVS